MKEEAGTEAAGVAGLDWRSFMEQPARYAEPARLVACFEHPIGRDACAQLLAAARLRDRLSDLLRTRYRLPPPIPPEALEEADRRIALAAAPQLAEIARRAGAIYWSASLASSVRAEEVKALHAALGEALWSFALANRDLSGPARPLGPVDGLAGQVAADGWSCLAAWCAAVPAAVSARVRLKLPAGALPKEAGAPPLVEAGPTLIRRAAAG